MAVPNPKTWLAAEFVDDAKLNLELRDSLNFLLNPPHCYGYRNAALSITTGGSEQLIGLDAEAYDWSVSAMHDLVTNNSRITIPETGLYTIFASATIAANATGRRSLTVRKNAAGVAGAGTAVFALNTGGSTGTFGTVVEGCKDYPLTAGDYIEMFMFQDSGGSLALTVGADLYTFLGVRWVSK